MTFCQVSTLRPFQHGWPYQEYKTPADIEFIETHKLPHDDKVVLEQNMMFIYRIQCFFVAIFMDLQQIPDSGGTGRKAR